MDNTERHNLSFRVVYAILPLNCQAERPVNAAEMTLLSGRKSG